MSWAKFLVTALLALALALLLAIALVVLMNPYGNLAVRAFAAHVIMDTNDRFQYPAIVRSGAFDSIVIGSSSSRLLDPARLEAAFGGRFANLAINDGRAWEQYRLTQLFLKTVPGPRTLLFGLDWVWCAEDADVARITRRGFPEWIYDEDRWNDVPNLLNAKSVEIAVRQLANRLGLMRATIAANGFEVFVPPESTYDAAKARRYIWSGEPRAIVPQAPAYAPTDAEREGWRYPALAWLEELLGGAPKEMRRILVLMPAHVAVQPLAGSREAAREAECKARIAGIATRHAAHLVDFKISSPITTVDANYWDPLHYRLPIAHRIVEGIGKAVATGRDDPQGDWAYLGGPSRR